MADVNALQSLRGSDRSCCGGAQSLNMENTQFCLKEMLQRSFADLAQNAFDMIPKTTLGASARQRLEQTPWSGAWHRQPTSVGEGEHQGQSEGIHISIVLDHGFDRLYVKCHENLRRGDCRTDECQYRCFTARSEILTVSWTRCCDNRAEFCSTIRTNSKKCRLVDQ